jgi:hypothetical protein
MISLKITTFYVLLDVDINTRFIYELKLKIKFNFTNF